MIAVLGWDDHRYLESYFAVPGIGTILQTVNVRLSPDQIVYTVRDAGARVLIYHPDLPSMPPTPLLSLSAKLRG